MPTLNKQPIFTGTIKTKPTYFDPPIPTNLVPINNWTSVYQDASSYGSLITKVTVTATALTGDTVADKIIYLGIRDTGSGDVTLYKSLLMTGLTLSSTDLPPQVIFTFETGDTQGLIIQVGQSITISASNNANNTGNASDNVAVIVEVSTYDQP